MHPQLWNAATKERRVRTKVYPSPVFRVFLSKTDHFIFQNLCWRWAFLNDPCYLRVYLYIFTPFGPRRFSLAQNYLRCSRFSMFLWRFFPPLYIEFLWVHEKWEIPLPAYLISVEWEARNGERKLRNYATLWKTTFVNKILVFLFYFALKFEWYVCLTFNAKVMIMKWIGKDRFDSANGLMWVDVAQCMSLPCSSKIPMLYSCSLV